MTNIHWKVHASQALGVVMLCILAYALYYAGIVFYGLEKEIKVALIAAASAFALTFITNFVQRQRELDF